MIEPDERRSRGRSFDRAARDYEQGRPEYPVEAIDWWATHGALPPGGRVLDLAAGTGKLTRGLVGRGCRVVAVEPLPNMRAEFAAVPALAGIEVLDGSAEAIPLADASVDAVFVGQAFHWFDPPPALVEIARVLRPGGGLGLVWNDDALDGAPEWVLLAHGRKADAGSELVRRGVDASVANVVSAAQFGTIERAEFRWSLITTPSEALASIASRSYVITLPDDERRALLAELAAALDAAVEVDADGIGRLVHPQLTSVFWCPLR